MRKKPSFQPQTACAGCTLPRLVVFIRLVMVLSFLLIYMMPFQAKAEKSGTDWRMLPIPLPKKFEVTGSRMVKAGGVSLMLPESQDVLISTAERLLSPLGTAAGEFEIRLTLTSEGTGRCPEHMRNSLAGLPNKEQAYAVEPLEKDGVLSGLILAGNTPLGLLYAVRTLVQIVDLSNAKDGMVEIPCVSILDWPDMPERGQWGGNVIHDIPWMAARKLNVIENHASLGFTNEGKPRADVGRALLDEAAREGIKIVPIIPHLEQLAYTGIFRYNPDIASTAEPGKPLPTDYEPGICYSAPKTAEILAEWMHKLLSIPGVDELMIWLSETDNRCWCEHCKDKEPFVLETESIEKAFADARKKHPGARLRILTTQASYEVNDKVLKAADHDTKISYYDGGRTYDSSHKPMIYPLLEEFARSGRWLGVYPQLTNSWRTVFPFTGPQFIHSRMTEFVRKGLSNFIGYATPSNRYYEFNITAAAEWGWNSAGRNIHEFAEAYAIRKRLSNPALFAEWAELIGPVGWNLAGSRVVESLVQSLDWRLYKRGMKAGDDLIETFKKLGYGGWMLGEYPGRDSLLADITTARKALKLAEKSNEPVMIFESRSVLSALMLLSGLVKLSEAVKLPEEKQKKNVKRALETIDSAVKTLTVSVYRWGMKVNQCERSKLPSRFRDSVDMVTGTASAAWDLGARLGLEDPHPQYRMRRVQEWHDGDFTKGADITLWADVTDYIREAGEYDVTFKFIEGASGIDTRSAALYKGASQETAEPVDDDRWSFHIGGGNRYIDYWLSVPPAVFKKESGNEPKERFFLKLGITGPSPDDPPDRRSSNGVIFIRKSWRDTEL